MPNWTQIQPFVQPADPYFEWAGESNFLDLFAARAKLPPDERWFPVILELARGRRVSDFAAREWHHPMQDSRNIVIPQIYRNLPRWAQGTRYCTAMVRKAFIEAFQSDASLRGVINRLEIGLPLKTAHKDAGWQDIKPMKDKPEQVVVGIIDDGLAFANAAFRQKLAKSRIEYFWNQDGLPTNPPGGFLEGWELRKNKVGGVDGIDDYLKDCTHAQLVDEDEVYARTNHVEFSRSIHKPVAMRGAHGTHVMDVATGSRLKNAPDDRPIICVQLPVATTADTSGASLAKYALDGLHYILARADVLGPSAPPIVVNLSYGMIAGPHDGTSILEKAIDELIELRQHNAKAALRVVLPSGNSRLSRCHAKFDLSGAGKEQALAWRLLPDDPTPSFMEIWLPKPANNPPVCQVVVTTPSGLASPAIQEGEAWALVDGADVLCKVLYLTTAAPGRTKNMVFIGIAPTVSLESARRVAPFGNWQVKVRKNNAGATTIDAWIQRDDTPYGYPVRGRQSRFDDTEANYPYWDYAGRENENDSVASYVKRDGTINAIGTGCKTTVVGGFRRIDWKPAKYSAGGSVIRPPGRGAPMDDGPDAMAVSDDSHAHRGILASGTRSGSTTAMNGTSVAAPQITRWIAEQMAASSADDRAAVAKFALQGLPASPWPATRTEATRPPNAPAPDPVQLPPKRIGAGRVEFPADRFPPVVDRKIER